MKPPSTPWAWGHLILQISLVTMVTGGIVALILQPDNNPFTSSLVFAWVVIAALQSYVTKRGYQDREDIGRWKERGRMADSMREAQQRGLSAEDWMVSYHERLTAEMMGEE